MNFIFYPILIVVGVLSAIINFIIEFGKVFALVGLMVLLSLFSRG